MRVNLDDTTTDETGTYRMYDGAPFTGEVVETAMDGTVVGLVTYQDGLERGPQREWYYDGQLRSEYVDLDGDRPAAVYQEWHENGRLAARKEFDRHGTLRKQEVWTEDGTPIPEQAVDNW
ncbi:MAG TPA: hypothetical protein VHF06_24575 [Pseudonocardiaceae bacterium]|jgi:antitoxin component YwqK of YwqJK toxin-antitoxin module|nr:hypothetical protein [Pseudonocardiaceae bacterium]